MSTHTTDSGGLQYLAGVCNIGPQEIAQRKRVGYLGLILTLATTIALLISHSSHAMRLLTFIPAAMFGAGYVQSRKKFCFAFGFKGVFNFGKLGTMKSVQAQQDLKADRAMALRIFSQSMAIAAVITVVVELIPVH
jgi:hypothetical protein